MSWQPYYRGDGVARDVRLAPPPPWRTFPRAGQPLRYQPPPGLADAVNAALHLRRPLLVTGPAGSGKSGVVDQVAQELGLGEVLRWHITSRSTRADALYRYDALGRIHAQNLRNARSGDGTGDGAGSDDIAPFLQLGPLGTALLPAEAGRPRAVLIDEIDKSDLDLPGDLLELLESGTFEIPELVRYREDAVRVRRWDGAGTHEIVRGRVTCTEFPFIVLTSNGERDFPPAFLRRCIRFEMPRPTRAALAAVVAAHLERPVGPAEAELVRHFDERLARGEYLAVDQLLNAVALLTASDGPVDRQAEELRTLLLRELDRD
ncbi:AAA family ATPase [Kitasatospora sp. NPDC088391]|uniref:AAA family ATPase n=1 Tax=Kitasatospora sp. NPDC088391 TaxID=3364074 RepID=UPI003817407D